ncbi:outer membrane murein-binding lipoprotein Lpp [Bradyrhizobium sp. USDA 3650]
MSEPMPEQAAQDTGVVEAAAPVPQAIEAAAGIEAPSIAPDHETPPKPDPVKPDPVKIEPPKIEASRIEVPKFEAKAEPKPETRSEPKPGKLIVMAPAERSWDREEFAPHVKADEPRETGGKRRLSAMAAVVAIAASVGAISGALATAGMMHFASPAPAQVADTSALESSVARIDADVVALKANVEHTSKTGLGQFNRTNDRLDKLEKAQAEPMAKIAKLSETVDKLRATPPAAPVQAAAAVPARETTGSIAPPTQVAAAAAAPAPAAPKSEVGRLPTVEGWVLRDVSNGGALVEGRGGLYEVYAGDPIPGVGRVDAIRRQDGRWVVVTSKGLIVAR